MWSPERISGRFEEFFPGESLSAKAIYNFTKYSRVDVSEYLTERGKRRRQRVTDRRKKFQEGAPPKRSIQERPQAVEDRTELGHYEADTIHSCRGGKKAILTIRERALRRTWYFPLKNLEASTVLPVLMVFFQRLPGALCKSLTVDNGSEWSEAHHKLEKVLPGFKVYFCRPYKSYERGAVENANRDLRRFYPKGTDFGTVDEEQIKQAEKLIANWPMKCLGWRTTDEAFTEALKLAA
jgi:IS30 family transposase